MGKGNRVSQRSCPYANMYIISIPSLESFTSPIHSHSLISGRAIDLTFPWNKFIIMASSIKPITFWGGPLGPNPGKVYMILKELDLPHERIEVALSDVKKPEYTKHNPNGRLPTIYDPNTDLTIWESGAIIVSSTLILISGTC